MPFGEENAKGRSVILHVVSSLDGFIARKDNSVSWLAGTGSVYEAGVSISEQEAATFLKTIDCYVLGSRTYEHALELGWPYGDTPTIVVTGRKLSPAKNSVEFYSGDLKTLVDVKLAPRYRSIWLVGGAMLCQRFLETRSRGRNQVDDSAGPIRRRTPTVRFPEGGKVEFEQRSRLQERLC